MAINSITAANAYQNQLKLMQGATDSESDSGGGASFADMLGSAINGAIDTAHKTEAVQVNALTGKAELSDLVAAVSNAQLTLSTVVAVRDRVISAYQDVIKMSI